jgi:hypothetical protein
MQESKNQTRSREKALNEAKPLRDDAVKPHRLAITSAQRALKDLKAYNAPIADVGPGFCDEICVYLKRPDRDDKAVYLYFYPQKSFFLLVSDANTPPEHGDYTPDVIPRLLQWLSD